MDKRFARSLAVVAMATLPLLVGCGASSTPSSSSAAPTGAQAPASSQAPSTETPSTSTTSPGAAPSASATPTVDTAQQTKQVKAATQKFVKTVLTIGYPDKSFSTYTDRIKPLMTKQGFDSLESADSTKKGSAALKSLHAQHARSAPKFSAAPEVTALEGSQATATLAYENVAQQQKGGDWKTLKSLGKGSVTVRLVLDGGTWLVEDAS